MAHSMAQAVRSLDLFRQVIATGGLDEEREIQAREASAEIAEMLFKATRDPSRLPEASQHYQAIIRLLKTPSPRRAKFLDKLAYLEMTIFEVTKSMKVLDDSVAHSKQARNEALPTKDPLLRLIYQNLGYSVSHRAQLTQNSADLDEAIACGREVLALSSPQSTRYQLTTNNLASRLHARYKMHHRSADAEEALSLVESSLGGFPRGSPQHGAALLVKAQILHDRYEQTQDSTHLDHAIAGFTKGLPTLGVMHERAPDLLRNLAFLHLQRYKLKKDIADLESALRHAKRKLDIIPKSYQTRPDHVADYLTYLVEYVVVIDSLARVQSAVEETRALRDEVPKTHAKRHSCNLSLAGILSRRYVLSRDIKHLIEVVAHILDGVYAWNEKLDITQPKVPTDSLYHMSSNLRDIERAPSGSPVRAQALEKLYEWHLDVQQSRTPFDSMVNLVHVHELEVDVFCRHLTASQRLSEEQLESGLETLRQEKAAKVLEDEKRQGRMSAFDRDDYIDPFFGHRKLAIDPTRKRIVLSVEGLVRSVLGYADDEEEPKTWAEYEAREARLERESFERDTKEGKLPNPDLCRVCRHVKLLKPASSETGSFEWDTKQYFPFGTYAQLLTRKKCVICRLVLSLTAENETVGLHPHLAQIDREIQGTQFHAQRLPSGEIMLGVEYGMTTIGALRVLRQDNVTAAVRQGFQTRGLQHYLGGTSPTPPSFDQGDQRIDFQKVRSWLLDCHNNHGERCNAYGHSQRYATDIPLILIDLQDNCLVFATSAKRYLTLSYVWGKVEIATTTTALLKDRLNRHSLDPSKFPKTIRDAMTFVRSVGERYLWTDALCIIQDDLPIRTRDISRMDIAYKKAFANIVALSGTDADAGLPGVTPNSRPGQKFEYLEVSKGSGDLALQKGDGIATDTVCMVATPIPLSFAQTCSVWNTRGWILQEQTLARRNIYFSASYVYLQCNEKTYCEVTLEGKFRERPAAEEGDEEDGEDNSTAMVIKNPIWELRKIGDVSAQEHLRLVFKAYCELVDIYTARNLTLETDVLDAFAGMLSAFEAEFKGSKTLYGLPIVALDLALLWTPTATMQRRITSKSTTTTTPSDAVSSSSSAPAPASMKLNFPTWSWVGWVGGVNYRLLPQGKEPPPDSLIAEVYIVRDGRILRLIGDQRACTDESAKASPEHLSAYFGRMSLETRQHQPDSVLHMFLLHVSNAGFTINTTREPDYLSDVQHVHRQTQQAVTRIHDKHGKHCGIIFEHVDYHAVFKLLSPTDRLRQSLDDLRTLEDKPMVAISQTKDAYGERTVLSRVEGDIKRFDANEFPAQGPGSALVNVLILMFGEGVFERIAVGQIHIKAWTEAGPRRAWVKIG